MLRNLAWQATDDLTRAQLTMFIEISDGLSLSENDRRQALGLSGEAWREWNEFVMDGALPAEPSVPEMMLRIGQAAFAASVMAELRTPAQQNRVA